MDLYEAWDAAEPNQGYAAKAAEWRGKLAAQQPATESPSESATEQTEPQDTGGE